MRVQNRLRLLPNHLLCLVLIFQHYLIPPRPRHFKQLFPVIAIPYPFYRWRCLSSEKSSFALKQIQHYDIPGLHIDSFYLSIKVQSQRPYYHILNQDIWLLYRDILIKFLEINVECTKLLDVEAASPGPKREFRLINFRITSANIEFCLEMEASQREGLVLDLLRNKFHLVCDEFVRLTDHRIERLPFPSPCDIAASQ